MTPPDTAVEIRGVTRKFGDFKAVDDATFSLDSGEFLTIVGPSGCGKTTLLRMIAGFDQPTRGDIYIAGKAMAEVPSHRRSIGMVFQRLALFPHMTAAQNVAYPLKMRRFSPGDIPALIEKYLKIVKLTGLENRRPHELSGGQQQRVAIARALSFGPDLLLLDEPLSALDKKLREEMQLEFRRIQQELGVTTINVTHDQREALVMSDRIVVMNNGVIQQEDSPLGVYRDPKNIFVAGFVGVTSMFKGSAAGSDGSTLLVEAGSKTLRARGTGENLAKNTPLDCAIRAEQIRIVEAKDAGIDQTVTGVIEQRIFEGERLVYEVRVAEMGDVVLYVFDHDPVSHREHPEGSRMTLGWNARDLFAFPAAT